MAVITVAGMIGAGKTTLTDLIADHLNFKPLYEDVDNSLILPLFYTASDEEKEEKRYSFLLQLDFLNSRFSKVKEALIKDDVVMDRSIYEDEHFARVLNKRGEISDLEFEIYQKLLHNMLEELQELPKKAPDLLVYLNISFELALERIGMRGREFEQDASLRGYYLDLWSSYGHWVKEEYNQSDILIINADDYDLVNSERDRLEVLSLIETKYNTLAKSY